MPKSCLKCLLLGREQTRCRVSINSLFIYYFVTSNLCSYNKGFGGGGGSWSFLGGTNTKKRQRRKWVPFCSLNCDQLPAKLRILICLIFSNYLSHRDCFFSSASPRIVVEVKTANGDKGNKWKTADLVHSLTQTEREKINQGIWP